MRISTVAASGAIALAVLAGCGDDIDDEAADPTTSAAVEAPSADDGEDGEGGAPDTDVAATVGGTEIRAAQIEEHVAAFSQNPQFAEQLEGAEGEAIRAQLRAQILSSTIITDIVATVADDLGKPVTDDDTDAARDELEEQFGGPEALDAALAEQGLTESLLELELTGLAGLRNIELALAEEDGVEVPETSAADPAQPTESQQRAQAYLAEQLPTIDVVVDEQYGTWDAASGQVLPPGAGTAPR